jgi:hypothetical protein
LSKFLEAPVVDNYFYFSIQSSIIRVGGCKTSDGFGETVILDTVTLNCCMIILWGVCFCLMKRLGLQANLTESFKIELNPLLPGWMVVFSLGSQFPSKP